jgi:hypothetical protein
LTAQASDIPGDLRVNALFSGYIFHNLGS